MPQAAVVAVTVAATAVSVAGQMQQAKATKRAAEHNAKVAEVEAVNTERAREENARRLRIQNRRLLASQRTALAKSGVTETGSPLELQSDTAADLETRVLDLNQQAEAKKQKLKSQAAITRFEGNQLASASRFGAAESGLSGASRTASLLN